MQKRVTQSLIVKVFCCELSLFLLQVFFLQSSCGKKTRAAKSLPPMVLSSKLLICNSIMRSWSSGLIIFTVLISSLQFWSLKYFVVLKRDYQPSSLIFCYYKAHDNLGFVKIQMIRLLGYIQLNNHISYFCDDQVFFLWFKIIIGYLKQVLNFQTLHFVLFRVSI